MAAGGGLRPRAVTRALRAAERSDPGDIGSKWLAQSPFFIGLRTIGRDLKKSSAHVPKSVVDLCLGGRGKAKCAPEALVAASFACSGAPGLCPGQPEPTTVFGT